MYFVKNKKYNASQGQFCLLQVANKLSAITCRVSWQVQVEDIDLAKRLISSKRLHIDDSLSKIDGVHFFISSITGTLSNSKRKGEAPDLDTVCSNFYPGVAYFITFSPSQLCNEEVIMKTLHDQDTEAEIKTIQARAVKCDEKPEDILSIMEKGVFQVIKDQNNGAVQKMVKESNQFCAAKHIAEIVKDITKMRWRISLDMQQIYRSQKTQSSSYPAD